MLYKIKFPAGAISGMLAQTLDTIVPTRQYHYHPDGSTVEFTPSQLEAFINELQENKEFALQDKEAYGDLIPELEEALETIRQAVMSSNIAEAGKYDALIKKCNLFHQMTTK